MTIGWFKNLTFISLLVGILFFSTSVLANLTQELLPTHLRWRIQTAKDQIVIKKEGNRILLQTLNEDFYQKITTELVKLGHQKDYFNSFRYSKEGYPEKPAEIVVDLKDPSVEMFSFYKETDQTYVMDFWINQDLIQTKAASLVKTPEKVAAAKPAKVEQPKTSTKVADKLKEDKGVLNVISPESIVQSKNNPNYRDFRYGASFLQEHAPYIPPLESDILLSSKAPDYLYQIKDRELTGDSKEAHMQLSINFYRKKQWGLMTKSIDLYTKKYGSDRNKVLNDFMKATVLIKNTIKEEIKPVSRKDLQMAEDTPPEEFSNKSTLSAGINLLSNVYEKAEDYDLKQAALRYVLQYYLDRNDYIRALQSAKNLYVMATENFDDPMTIYSSKVILYSLAQLRQLDKITEFLSNKAVMRLLPAQEGLAYKSYVGLINNQNEELIKEYQANKASFAQPVHPAIIYNTAEAYFREANYEESYKLMDYFLAHYPGLTPASRARLTLALSYDLLDRPVEQVLKLYQDAINRSADPAVSYEAKLRYVGLRIARNLSPKEVDLETIAFLEKGPTEKKVISSFHNKLLWQVRLRYFIVNQEFDKALAYINSIPLNTLPNTERKVFEGDGAEIVVGLIKKKYMDADYAGAVKVWEVYKDKYEKQVAKSAYLAFIVSDSFLRLGLNESFSRSYATLKKAQNNKVRTYPAWIAAHKELKVEQYLAELDLLQAVYKKDWAQVNVMLTKIDEKARSSMNYDYYAGLMHFHRKNFGKAIEHFEKIIVGPNQNNMLSVEQNAQMLVNYVESLYQNNDSERFRKNALALANDMEKSKQSGLQSVAERVYYLLVEDFFSEGKKVKTLEQICRKFLGSYPESTYLDRVNFIYGHTLAKNKKTDDAKMVLRKLIDKQDTAEYLKGLARSELSSLEIKEKTL